MSASTAKAARTLLADRIRTAALTHVDEVYNHEPAAYSGAVVVTISSAGFTPVDWRILVRVYVSDTMGAETAQDLLDDVAYAVDNLLTETPRPPEWDAEHDDDHERFVAFAVVEYPREDF